MNEETTASLQVIKTGVNFNMIYMFFLSFNVIYGNEYYGAVYI